MTVNTASYADPGDGTLTFAEAIELADGVLAPSALSVAQRAQIFGQIAPTNQINFNIPGAGVHQILPTSGLPAITRTVTIDGYSEPGSRPNTLAVGDNAVLLIELSGTRAPASSDGLFLDGAAASGSVVQGLIVNDWGHGGASSGPSGGLGIDVFQGTGHVIRGNFLGTDPTGLIPVPNLGAGVNLDDSEGDVVGGADAGSRNVAAVGGAASGQVPLRLDQETGARVQGNYLGVGANGLAFAGLTPASSLYAIELSNSTLNLIGGAATGAGNVVSGVRFFAEGEPVAVGNNTVQGNLIGVDASGLKALPGTTGVEVENSTGNLIGGGLLSEANEIASPGGDAVAVRADDHSTYLGTLIEGNDIGSDPTGTADFGDRDGVLLASSFNFVGGADPTLGNRISHSRNDGVETDNGGGTGVANRNPILSNRISLSGVSGISYNPVQPQTPTVSVVGLTAGGQTDLIGGAFHGVAGATYTVQFFFDAASDPGGVAEGQTFIASIPATGRADGLVVYSWSIPAYRLAGGKVASVTATGPGGNTSQFANGLAVGAPLGVNVTLAASASRVIAGRPLTLNATVTAPAGLWVRPGGNVVFLDGGVFLGVATLGSSGVVQFTTSGLTPGLHKLTASYRGDATYNGTDSTFVTVMVVA